MNKITVCTVCLELGTPTPCRKCGNGDVRLLSDASGKENKRGLFILTLEEKKREGKSAMLSTEKCQINIQHDTADPISKKREEQ
jgi:hypothetical protein